MAGVEKVWFIFRQGCHGINEYNEKYCQFVCALCVMGCGHEVIRMVTLGYGPRAPNVSFNTWSSAFVIKGEMRSTRLMSLSPVER
jgi:hypothetical protein